MKVVKMPTNDSYHEYLIESLKDIEEVAGYIEIVLEEGDDDPKLLPKVLKNVIEAYNKKQPTFHNVKQHYEELNLILKESNCREIYTFLRLLNALGLKINISPVAMDN